MLMEFLAHLVSFDLVWIVSFILGNLHWFFLLFAPAFIFYNEKRVIMPFLLVVFLSWAMVDFTLVSGWVFAVPAFLSIFYISRMTLIVFCSDMDRLKNILPVVFVAHFLVLFAIFNLFMR